MKKVVVASLLAVASVACVAGTVVAQTQVNLGSNAQAAGGDVQLSPAEYKAYNDAISQIDAADQGAGARAVSDGVSAVDVEGVRAGAADAGL